MKKLVILLSFVLLISSPAFAMFEKSPDFQSIDVSEEFRIYGEGELDYSKRDENPEHYGKVIGTEEREMVFRTWDYIPKKMVGKVTEEDRQSIITWVESNTATLNPIVYFSCSSLVVAHIDNPTTNAKETILKLYEYIKSTNNLNSVIHQVALYNDYDYDESYWIEDFSGKPNLTSTFYPGLKNKDGDWCLSDV